MCCVNRKLVFLRFRFVYLSGLIGFLVQATLLHSQQGLATLEDIETSPVGPALQGTWLLPADQNLFMHSVPLQFYFYGNELRAKVSQGTKSDLIWNLRAKNGEYLYGWIRPGAHQQPGARQHKIYRCKLWQRRSHVYLRVYIQPSYKTYTLSPVYVL